MTRKTKKEVTPSNVWTCCTCESHPDFEPKDMIEHLRTVHGFEPKGQKARRSMVAHVDAADYFTFTFEWEINGVKLIRSERSRISKNLMTIPELINDWRERSQKLAREAWEHEQHGRNYSSIEATAWAKLYTELSCELANAWAEFDRATKLDTLDTFIDDQQQQKLL